MKDGIAGAYAAIENERTERELFEMHVRNELAWLREQMGYLVKAVDLMLKADQLESDG